VHCYLDHDDHGEMTTAEIKDVLDQLAGAGVFFLTLSGGEVFLRRDFFEILEHARRLMFAVKIKTNAVMIGEAEARRIRELAVDTIQISLYSHRPEIHDAITKLPHSFERTVRAICFLRDQRLRVTIANVLMTSNSADQSGVQALAAELGVHYTLDPTITPMMDGDTSVLSLRIPGEELPGVFRNPALVSNQEEFCAPPKPPSDDDLEGYSCSAGHSFCYISPYGDVFPCVQFPLPTGNIRRQKFLDIWDLSPEMREVRSIQAKDLTVCSSCSHVASCSRCPGLAYMEGNMRGPSSADCEKSFYRTGVPTANMLQQGHTRPRTSANLVQIRPLAVSA
jgi:AdoMet-dependent heme synthase